MVKPINRPSTPTAKSSNTAPVQPKERSPATGSRSANATHEQVALSSKAKMAQDVAQAARQSPGVDSARVRFIRQAIANGNYQVSPTAIARAVAEVAWMSQGKK